MGSDMPSLPNSWEQASLESQLRHQLIVLLKVLIYFCVDV
jgi:hypothetical protein